MRAAIKRIYDAAGPADGTRILVDRLWPRGISKQAARVDIWLKEIAPSTPLRKWFAHDPGKFKAFAEKYRQELIRNPGPVKELKQYLAKGKLTLLYAAISHDCNHALVLLDFILENKD